MTSLTTHDKNHQQFETKRNNMIMLLKLRTCRLKNDVQRLNNNWNPSYLRDNGATIGCSCTVYIDKLSYKQRQDE